MPDVSSRRFVEVFQKALAASGKISDTDLKAMTAAQGKITNVNEKAAAESILAMVRNDQEFDSFEVAPTRKALGVRRHAEGGRGLRRPGRHGAHRVAFVK